MKDKKSWINKYFSKEELAEIQGELNKVELNTTGEILLSLREKRKFLDKLYSPHELAWKDFKRLGVANTKERTGVLVFILFGERYYDIIADEGIYAKIEDKTWNKMEEELKTEFKNKNYAAGLMKLIKSMEEVLCREFPCKAGEKNQDELSDELFIS